MFKENFEIISSETIRWLSNLPCYNLDYSMRASIERILKNVSNNHPGGLAYRMSIIDGASHEEAILVGTVAELVYAWNKNFDILNEEDSADFNRVDFLNKFQGMTSFTDLMHQRILGASLDDSTSIGIINKLSDYILCVSSKWSNEFKSREDKYASNWNAMSYNNMACDTLGRTFRFCMWLCSSVKKISDKSIYESWGQDFGSLMQIVNDANSSNDRIVTLTKYDNKTLKICWDYRENVVRNFQFPDSDAGELMKFYSDGLVTLSKRARKIIEK